MPPSDAEVAAPVEFKVRHVPGGPTAKTGRERTRKSLAYFGHLSDLHVVDEMSPLRVEFVDPAPVGGFLYQAAWRPQEALSAQILDAAVRGVNEAKLSVLRQGNGNHAKMQFALVTGDLIDNMQRNEMRIALDVLTGGRVDPYSGARVGPENPCLAATPEEVATLNQRVAMRAYSGVQRFSQYPNHTPEDRLAVFYDPGTEPVASPTPKFPRYDLPGHPGLLDQAQASFEAGGLDVPFFVARGNHGALVQGNYPDYFLQEVYRLNALGLGGEGCRKVFPSAALDPYASPFNAGAVSKEIEERIVARLKSLYASTTEGTGAAVFVPPDARRRLLTSPDFPKAFRDIPNRAGYDYVDPEERAASNGYAHYYAWSPRPGLKLISLDTNPLSLGPNGSLGNPQFQWLAKELAATPSNTLTIVYGHHALATLDNDLPAPVCPPSAPDCLGDPRPWAPNHIGCPRGSGGLMNCKAPFDTTKAPDNVRDLFLKHPTVALYVSGHTHINRITPYSNQTGGGFWEVTTASVIEWPQVTRSLEIMDNRDGTLSIFARILEMAFDEIGAAGPSEDLALIGQGLALGDVEWRTTLGRMALGRIVDGANIDGNVELILADPRSRP